MGELTIKSVRIEPEEPSEDEAPTFYVTYTCDSPPCESYIYWKVEKYNEATNSYELYFESVTYVGSSVSGDIEISVWEPPTPLEGGTYIFSAMICTEVREGKCISWDYESKKQLQFEVKSNYKVTGSIDPKSPKPGDEIKFYVNYKCETPPCKSAWIYWVIEKFNPSTSKHEKYYEGTPLFVDGTDTTVDNSTEVYRTTLDEGSYRFGVAICKEFDEYTGTCVTPGTINWYYFNVSPPPPPPEETLKNNISNNPELCNLFRKYDSDDDGYISDTEMLEAVNDKLKDIITDDEYVAIATLWLNNINYKDYCCASAITITDIEPLAGGKIKVYGCAAGSPDKTAVFELYIDDSKVDILATTVDSQGMCYPTFEVDVSGLSVGTHKVKICSCGVCSSEEEFEIKEVEVGGVSIDVKTDISYFKDKPIKIVCTVVDLPGEKLRLIIDGNVSKEVDVTDTSFQYTFNVVLSPGSHTIKACAGDVCSDTVTVDVLDKAWSDVFKEAIENEDEETFMSEFYYAWETRSTDFLEDLGYTLYGFGIHTYFLVACDWIVKNIAEPIEDYISNAFRPFVRSLFETIGFDNFTRDFVDYWIDQLKDVIPETELREASITNINSVLDALGLDKPKYVDYPIPSLGSLQVWAILAVLGRVALYVFIAYAYHEIYSMAIWRFIDNMKMSLHSKAISFEKEKEWVKLWNYLNKDYQAGIYTMSLVNLIGLLMAGVLSFATVKAIFRSPVYTTKLGLDPDTLAKIDKILLDYSKLGESLLAAGIIMAPSAYEYWMNTVVIAAYQCELDAKREMCAKHLGIENWKDVIPMTSFVRSALENGSKDIPSSDDYGAIKVYTDPPGGVISILEEGKWKLASVDTNPAYVVYKTGTYRFKIHNLDYKGYIYAWEGNLTISGKEIKEYHIDLVKKEAFIPPGIHDVVILTIDSDDPLIISIEYQEGSKRVRLAGLESTRRWSSGFDCSTCGHIGVAHDEWLVTGKDFLTLVLDWANDLCIPTKGVDAVAKIDGYVTIGNETLPLAVLIRKEDNENINKLYLSNGVACYNRQYNNKYVDPGEFIRCQIDAVENDRGMWKYDKITCPKITINIITTPSSTIYIDRKKV